MSENGMTVFGATESAVVIGDLSKLNETQRAGYYTAVCSSLGLNPLTKPFDYITLNGKLTLYARKDATDQIRATRGVSIIRLEREKMDGIYCVTAYAESNGRQDSAIGAVNVDGLKGDALANAMMKAETKAKRRVTLSICGLGMLDETELETIPHVTQPFPREAAASLPSGESKPMTLEEASALCAKDGRTFGSMTLAELSAGLTKVTDRLEKNSLTEAERAPLVRMCQALEMVIESKREVAA